MLRQERLSRTAAALPDEEGDFEMLGKVLTGTLWTAAITATLAGTLLAQAPPAAPAAASAFPTTTDANNYKVLVPYFDFTMKRPTDPAEIQKFQQAFQTARERVTRGNELARNILTGGAGLAENKGLFDFYYNRMLIPQFTQTNDKALADLPQERNRLFRDHLEACTVPTVHTYLVNMIFERMKEIVQDNYHPAARYNAMLTISGLNDVDASRLGAVKTTPEPMMAALPFIYEQFTKADNSDVVRLPALMGLVRHLEWDNFRGSAEPFTPQIPATTRDAIVKSLLELAQQKEPPAGRNAAGHEWFRRRAIEGLTHASYYQVAPEIADALDKLLKDESESLAMRCAAATAIGHVAFSPPVKVELKPAAIELGYLALLACDKELTRVADLKKLEDDHLMRLSGGAAYGSAGSGYGAGAMPGSSGSGYSEAASGGYGSGYGSMPGADAPNVPGGAALKQRQQGGRTDAEGTATAVGAAMPGYGYGSAGSSEGYGYEALAPKDPKQYRFDLIRRRIRTQLYAVEVGLGGPDVNLKSSPKLGDSAAAATISTGPARGVESLAKGTPDEKFVVDLHKDVSKLVETVEAVTTDMADLEKTLRKHMKTLENRIPKKLAAPASTSVADEPEVPAPAPGITPSGAGRAAPQRGPAPAAVTPAPASGPASNPATPASAPMPPATPAPAPPPQP
jgi:hypothetical protein